MSVLLQNVQLKQRLPPCVIPPPQQKLVAFRGLGRAVQLVTGRMRAVHHHWARIQTQNRFFLPSTAPLDSTLKSQSACLVVHSRTYLGHIRDRIYHTVRKLWGRTDEHGSVPGDGSSHCLGV